MQTKSAQQIQAELKLIRLAYRDRRREELNHYLAEPDPMVRAVFYIASALLAIGVVYGVVAICIR